MTKSVTAPRVKRPAVSRCGYINEALVHGWDLAVATGQPAEADSALVEPVLAMVAEFLPAHIRVPGVPFGAVAEPRQEAGPTERLANWSGRSADGGVSPVGL